MLDVQIDARTITARLSAMPDKLRAAFLKKTYALAEKLKSKVQQNLTNNLLHIRSGNLVRSIFEEVKNETNSVSGRVYSSGVAYARIQEYGGQTKPTLSRPSMAKRWRSTWAASRSSSSGSITPARISRA
jgi:phage gpG-like protein